MVLFYSDIPMPLVTSGVEHGNLRELALARMKDLGTQCRDVRTREVGIQEIHNKVRPYEVCIWYSNCIMFSLIQFTFYLSCWFATSALFHCTASHIINCGLLQHGFKSCRNLRVVSQFNMSHYPWRLVGSFSIQVCIDMTIKQKHLHYTIARVIVLCYH